MIKLKEVRDWIDTLPEEFLEFDVVNAEEGILTEDGEYTYRMDKPVVSLNVDVDNQEILILNQMKDEEENTHSK
jgi:hypothetical protein